jgi:hypothetical protein
MLTFHFKCFIFTLKQNLRHWNTCLQLNCNSTSILKNLYWPYSNGTCPGRWNARERLLWRRYEEGILFLEDFECNVFSDPKSYKGSANDCLFALVSYFAYDPHVALCVLVYRQSSTHMSLCVSSYIDNRRPTCRFVCPHTSTFVETTKKQNNNIVTRKMLKQ